MKNYHEPGGILVMTIEELIENLKNESYNSGPDYQKLIDINQEIFCK